MELLQLLLLDTCIPAEFNASVRIRSYDDLVLASKVQAKICSKRGRGEYSFALKLLLSPGAIDMILSCHSYGRGCRAMQLCICICIAAAALCSQLLLGFGIPRCSTGTCQRTRGSHLSVRQITVSLEWLPWKYLVTLA